MGCSSSKHVLKSVNNRDIASYNEQQYKRDQERILSNALTKEKNSLQSKALIMMEKRLSHEDLSGYDSVKGSTQLFDQSLNQNDELTQSKKLKQNKRKQAKLLAEKENKWMLFSNTDLFDENEMLEIATFMELLITKVPAIQSSSYKVSVSPEDGRLRSLSVRNLKEYNIDEDGIILSRDDITNKLQDFVASHSDTTNDVAISLPRSKSNRDSARHLKYEQNNDNNTIEVKRANSVDRLFRLDKIALEQLYKPEKHQNIIYESTDPSTNVTTFPITSISSNPDKKEDITTEYELPTGFITMAIANEIIDVYKANGRLSAKAVHKLQRLSYRRMVKLPNINYVNINSAIKLTVIGDLHGQLVDLLHILDESGVPSDTHKYVFNGDFVDRGPYGVEVVCILLALFLAAPPGYVNFNRGNHEDYAICSAYSFQKECLEKYDEITFGMFVEIFNYLPMFTIVNHEVFIVHGGLFHTIDVTISELNDIKRHEFSLLDLTNSLYEDPDSTDDTNESLAPIPRSKYTEFLKQLQRDALWSDPKDSLGIDYNPRGAGISFGPDITNHFLLTNNLKFIIRSHECVKSGFEKPYVKYERDDDINDKSSNSLNDQFIGYDNLLCTLFSASNYGNSGNTAAYIVLTTNDNIFHRYIVKNMIHKINHTNLIYSVHYYYNETNYFADDEIKQADCAIDNQIDSKVDNNIDADDNTVIDFDQIKQTTENSSELFNKSKNELADSTTDFRFQSIDISNESTSYEYNKQTSFSLFHFILKKKIILHDNFQSNDKLNNKLLSIDLFIDIFNHILKIHLNWLVFIVILYINRINILNELKKQCLQSNENQFDSNEYNFLYFDSNNNLYIYYELFLNFVDDVSLLANPSIIQLNQLIGDMKDISINSNTVNNEKLIEKIDRNVLNTFKNQVITIDNLFFHLLYEKSDILEQIFEYLDIDKNNIITFDEFIKQCDIVNQTIIHSTHKIDYKYVYSLLDIKGNNEIDINIFFEMYRISKGFYLSNHSTINLIDTSVDNSIKENDIIININQSDSEDIIIDSYLSSSLKIPRNISLSKLASTDELDILNTKKLSLSPKHHNSINDQPTIDINGKLINVDAPMSRSPRSNSNGASNFEF